MQYEEYKKKFERLQFLKQSLKKMTEDRANIRTKYVNYLKANPYKIDLKKLNKLVDKYTNLIIKEISE